MIDMICESEVSLVVNGIQDRGRGPQNFCSTPRSASIYHRWYPVGYDHMICTSRLQGYHPHRYPDPSRVVYVWTYSRLEKTSAGTIPH